LLGERPSDLTESLLFIHKAVEQLTSDMHRFAHSQLQLSGLLLVADLGRDATQLKDDGKSCVVLEPGPRLKTGGVVNALCLPPDVDTWPQFVSDLREGFQLVIEELLGKP